MKKQVLLFVACLLGATAVSFAGPKKQGQEAHGTWGNSFCEELAKVIDLESSPFAEECRKYTVPRADGTVGTPTTTSTTQN